MSSVKSGRTSMVLRSYCDGISCNKTSPGHTHHKKHLTTHSGSSQESLKTQQSKEIIKSKVIESAEVSSTVINRSSKTKSETYTDSHSVNEDKASTVQTGVKTRQSKVLDTSEFDILAATSTSTPRQLPVVVSAEYMYGVAKKYLYGWFNETKPKTDYTYSRTATYLSYSDSEESYESPNMSRQSLRTNNNRQSFSSKDNSFSIEYSSHDQGHGLSQSSHNTNQNTQSSYYARNTAAKSHNKLSSALQNTLSTEEYTNYRNHYIEGYGLDYTSDVSDPEYEDSGSIERASRRRHVISKKKIKTSSIFYRFTSLLRKMAGAIFTWFWQGAIIFYTVSSSLVLFDYWLLARNGARCATKRCLLAILLPLFLILSFLGLSYLRENGLKEVMPWIPPFLISNQYEYVQEEFNKVNVAVSKDERIMTDEMKQFILRLYQDQHYQINQQNPLSKDQVEHIVRNVIKQELSAYAKKEEQIKAEALIKQVDFEKELESAKENIQLLFTSPNAEALVHIKHLEDMITSLKDDVKRLEYIQEVMVLDVKRCCNNESSLLANIQKHLNETIVQMVNDNRDLTKIEFTGLNNWIKSQFVANHELDSKLGAVISEVTAKVAAAEKAVMEKAALDKAAAERAARDIDKSSTVVYVSSQNNNSYALGESQIREIVREALRNYSADKIGMVDYALESAGGSVLSTKCSETYHTRSALMSLFGIPLFRRSNSPRTAIQPEVYPGQCWAFKGAQGYIVIQLSGVVKPTAFSVEHIPKSLSPTGIIDSAPKNFSVYGLKCENTVDGILLGTYSYDQDGEPLQYFPVQNLDAGSFPIVELRINSNHGNMEYTCLYRFRVHGILEN